MAVIGGQFWLLPVRKVFPMAYLTLEESQSLGVRTCPLLEEVGPFEKAAVGRLD